MTDKSTSVEEQIRAWADDLAQGSSLTSSSQLAMHAMRRRRRHLRACMATAAVIMVVVFGLWVRDSTNERLVTSSEPTPLPPTSPESTEPPTSPTVNTEPATVVATSPPDSSATSVAPVVAEAGQPPQGAVGLEIIQLAWSSVQEVIGEPGSRELVIILVGGLPYNETNLCTRHYQPVVSEGPDQIDVGFKEFRPPGEQPIGCRLIGGFHRLEISLEGEVGTRTITVLGRPFEMSKP